MGKGVSKKNEQKLKIYLSKNGTDIKPGLKENSVNSGVASTDKKLHKGTSN